jgi:PEP-CTERM motif-containing protein
MRQYKRASFLVASSGRRYFSIACLTLCILTIFWASLNAHRSTKELLTTAEVAMTPIWPLASAVEQVEKDHRVVFPYSIIPGGAESLRELRQAVTKDPVVARHYSDFDLARVRRITLSAPQSMYVSYRIGNDVFWTKHRLTLPKGETMLTDGRAMARTRCGNRVSAVPSKPNALVEPTAEELNASMFGPSVSTPYLAAYSAPLPAFPSASATQPAESSILPFVPTAIVSFLPLPGGGSGSGSSGTTPPPIVTSPDPPVGVSEPGTAGLVLVGLGAACLMGHNRKNVLTFLRL